MTRTSIKKRLYAEQARLCVYCSDPMTLDWERPLPRNFATVDHIIPISRHGISDEVNMVICCLSCNRHKRSHTVETLRRMADVIEILAFERGLIAFAQAQPA